MNTKELWKKYNIGKIKYNNEVELEVMTFDKFNEAIAEIISLPVEAEVMQKIIKTIDNKIFQESIKHDNTMFGIKKEALEYFHQLYEFKIDFLKALKKELIDNFSA